MSQLFTEVNVLAELLAGRKPIWERQGTLLPVGGGISTGTEIPPPSRTTDGIELNNATTTLVAVDLRADVSKRTCRVTFLTVDLTGSYRTVINGNILVFVSAASDLNDLIIGWRDLINATAPTNTIVVARGEDTIGATSAPLFDTLVIEGLTPVDYSCFLDTSGSAVILGTLDPFSAKATVFVTYRPLDASEDPEALWRTVPGALYDIDTDNFVARVATAGADRIYVQVTDVRGIAGDGTNVFINPNLFRYAARITIGPAGLETATPSVV